MFHFAWLDTGDTVFGVEHHVEDEQVIAWKIDHQENDFAALSIEVENPQVGLLGEDRERWCWFSWRKPDDTVVPLFHGRLIGIPEDIDKEVVTLEFRARPADFEAQKAALAETLKVAPFWDPIWVDEEERDNPDVVLESRPQLWHIGRTDKTVTVSHILNGEAGTIAFGESQVLHESLSLSFGERPIQHVRVEATVNWDQHATGTVDFRRALVEAFNAAGSAPHLISSYTGQGLEADWPRYGASIGAGWTVDESRVELLSGASRDEEFHTTTIDPSLDIPEITPEEWWEASPEGYDYWYQKALDKAIAEKMNDETLPRSARFYLWEFRPTFNIRYDATRRFKEVLTFEVFADMQEFLVEDEAETKEIQIQTSYVTDPVDPADALPIGDRKNRSYFRLDRARQSIAYLLSLVRSQILSSARAVEVSFEVPFEDGVDLSCRHNVALTLDALPGGECVGKVIGYTLLHEGGDDGAFLAQVTIGCSVGRGNTLGAPSAGTPTYVEEGYVDDYQHYAGAGIQPIAGEITYEDFTVTPGDDDVDFDDMRPETVIAATAASALFTFTGVGANNDTITIGGRVYRLRTLPAAINDVAIGSDAEETARNLTAAINRDEAQEGTAFFTGTTAHANVSATVNETIVRVTARVPGPGGNSIAVSESTAGSWGSGTLENGDDGLHVHNGPDDQLAVLGETYGTVDLAIEALNAAHTEVELALKPVTGGPFETLIEIEVSDLMVPKTIDLEAA